MCRVWEGVRWPCRPRQRGRGARADSDSASSLCMCLFGQTENFGCMSTLRERVYAGKYVSKYFVGRVGGLNF